MLIVVVFLLLGAVVNVAVAWGLAMSVDVGLFQNSALAGIVSSDETLGWYRQSGAFKGCNGGARRGSA